MSMAFHWIPARHGQSAQDDLNRLLRSVRVLSVEKHFYPGLGDPGWAVCVEYLDTAGMGGGGAAGRLTAGKSVDYREVLDAETFAVFAALRKLRKEFAGRE